MFDWLSQAVEKIKEISSNIDKYKKDTVIQSLPSYSCVSRAKKLIEQKKFDEAKAVLQKALSLPQKDSLVYKYLGIVDEKLGDNSSAIEHYQMSADLEPHDKEIWKKLGFALISAGKFEQAEKSFENANKIQGNNTDTFTGWGMALMKQQKYAAAREKFLSATKYNRYNFSAVFLCAVMEIKLEMYDKAEMKLTFLANVCPNESNTFEFARLKALKNDISSAIHYAKKSLEYNDNMLPAYVLLGQLYANSFEKEKSLECFEKAEQKKLESPTLYLEWAKVLEKFGDYDEAKIKLLKSLELDGDNLEITANLGLCCVNRKEYDEAGPLLEKVLEKEPENLVVKQSLGIINYEHGEIDKAIELFKSNDEDCVNCYYLAKCYEKKNNDTKVKDYYEAAITHNPRYISAFVDYSKYLISKSEYDEARRKLRKALRMDENNTTLLNLLFFVNYILVKDEVYEYNVKETIKIAQKIEEINPDLFEYPEQKAELEKLLHDSSERE